MVAESAPSCRHLPVLLGQPCELRPPASDVEIAFGVAWEGEHALGARFHPARKVNLAIKYRVAPIVPTSLNVYR